jgi:hypothetical protein
MTGTVQRALELARAGELRSIAEIKAQLMREQCDAVDDHLSGRGIKRQILEIIRDTRAHQSVEAGSACSDVTP